MIVFCNVYLLYKMASTPKIDLTFPALNGTHFVGPRITFSHNTMQGVSLNTIVVSA